MDVHYYHHDEVVFHQGSPGSSFYIVIEGCVEMRRGAEETVIATYQTHDERPWFGELALWSAVDPPLPPLPAPLLAAIHAPSSPTRPCNMGNSRGPISYPVPTSIPTVILVSHPISPLPPHSSSTFRPFYPQLIPHTLCIPIPIAPLPPHRIWL